MLIVKLWFHLSAQQQRRRLEADRKAGLATPRMVRRFARRYDRFRSAAEDKRHARVDVVRTVARVLHRALAQ